MPGKYRKQPLLTLALRVPGPVLAGVATVASLGAVAHPAAAQTGPETRVQTAPEATRKPTAQDAVKLAVAQTGTKEDARGKTRFQSWYMTTARAQQTVKRDGGSIKAYADAQWCDMFVSWVGAGIGLGDQVGADAYTVEHARWFKKQGRFGRTPKPGAVVFFDWRGGRSIDGIVHVGMVIKRNADGTVSTVEGNTGNAVRLKTRRADQIVGYGYPGYAR
ncbi:CHAP domain-containing protein [Actinomadura hibisca]|uniref:CHAP domain-containing protein n=1 Tax=Actinomadura hibisca TaxID=68565 RepID=UPI000AEFBE28|nr:CHAP domain-containing protein [Actinomadura hibisca]